MENFTSQLQKIENNSILLLDYLKIYLDYYIEMKYNIHIKRTYKEVPFEQGLSNYMAQQGFSPEINISGNSEAVKGWNWITDEVIEEKIFREFTPITFKESMHMVNQRKVSLNQYKKMTEQIIKNLK